MRESSQELVESEFRAIQSMEKTRLTRKTQEAVEIVVASSYPVERHGLRKLLEERPNWCVVAEAGSVREAVAKVTELRPKLVIIDSHVPLEREMPPMDAADASRLILDAAPTAQVLVFARAQNEVRLASLMSAGVRGFVMKTDDEAVLVTAIEALIHGAMFLSPAASGFGQPEHGDRREIRKPPLTQRELEVLHLVAQGKSNKEVASSLGISRRTAENHRARVMRKVGARSPAELVHYAIRNGLANI